MAFQTSLFTLIVRAMTPTGLMLSTWIAYLLVVGIGPVQYNRSISWTTYCLLFSCVGAFVLGSRFVQNLASASGNRHASRELDARRRMLFNRSVRGFAILGLLGTLCIAVDKVVIGGLNVFQNLGALRLELNVDAGMPNQGTILMWVGMAIYSFANVALILYFLEGEICERSTARLAALASFCPGLVILLYGGRSSAIFVIFLIIGSGIVRVHCGRRAIPRAHYMRSMLITHSLLVLVGSLYIFSSRAVAFGYSDNGAMLHQFSWHLNATISPVCQELIAGRTRLGELLANLLMGLFYFTQGFPEMDYLLTENSDAGPFFGGYQGWFVYRVIVELLGIPNGLPEMELQIHHSGLFFSAWGGMLLDFGPWGAPLVTSVLGSIAGYVYDRGIRLHSIIAKLTLVYFYMYILLTPIHSVFAVGNATQIFLCIIAASIVLNRSLGSAARQPSFSSHTRGLVRVRIPRLKTVSRL